MTLRGAFEWFAPPFYPAVTRQRRTCGTRWLGRRSWIGWLLGWTDRYAAVTLALALTALALTLLAGIPSPGWDHAFLHSQGWAFIAVIAWVLGWGEWSDRNLFVLPDRIRGALRQPLTAGEIDNWRRRFYNVPRDLVVGAVPAGVFLWLGGWRPQIWQSRFPSWATHPHVAKAFMGGALFLGGMLMVTMLYGLWNYLSFAAFVLRKPLTPNLERARSQLQGLTAFGLSTGFGWSVAVALFADIAARGGHSLAFAVVAALATLGFALILAPQFLAHQALIVARNTQLNLVQGDRQIRSLATMRLWIQSPVDAMLFLAQIAAAIGALAAAR